MTVRRGAAPLLVLLALTGCTSEEPANIQLAEVRRAPVTEVVEAPATIGARASATLRSPAQGTIAKLYVKDGDRVRKGEIVAKIRSPQAEDQLRQARQASQMPAPARLTPNVRLPTLDTGAFDRKVARHFAKARAQARKVEDPQARKQLLNAIDLARAQHDAQTKALASITTRLSSSISGVLGNVTSGLSASMASLQAASKSQARAAVKAAERAVGSLTVKSPISGVVTLGRVSGGAAPGGMESLLGALPGGGQQLPSVPSAGSAQGTPVANGIPVSAGDTLATITDISRLTLDADVDETDVLLVRKGVKAEVELDAVPGATYRAEVTGIGVTPMEATTGGVSYPVRLTLGPGLFDDGSEAPTPKPGMSAVTRLTVRESPSAVSAPASAIVSSGRESVVWAVSNGVAHRRVVKLGAQGDASVEVVSGLSVGERIVIRGADSVRQGQSIP